jgi:hypothetical protein
VRHRPYMGIKRRLSKFGECVALAEFTIDALRH